MSWGTFSWLEQPWPGLDPLDHWLRTRGIRFLILISRWSGCCAYKWNGLWIMWVGWLWGLAFWFFIHGAYQLVDDVSHSEPRCPLKLGHSVVNILSSLFFYLYCFSPEGKNTLLIVIRGHLLLQISTKGFYVLHPLYHSGSWSSSNLHDRGTQFPPG